VARKQRTAKKKENKIVISDLEDDFEKS